MKFQIERIALFSDAVFAIAITLMMIEVKPPHIPHEATTVEALNSLVAMSGTFVGTIMSFCLIGFFWMRHHALLKYLSGYTFKLLWLNLMFLLSISFIPFATTFVFENGMSHSSLPWVVYNGVYLLATFLCYALFMYVLNPRNNIRTEEVDEDIPTLKKELLFPAFVYILVIVFAVTGWVFPALGYAAFGLEPFVTGRRKKAPEDSRQQQAV